MHRSKTSAFARLFDHLVGAGKSVDGTSRPSAFNDQANDEGTWSAARPEDRRASPPAKSCRLSRRRAAEGDERRRADGVENSYFS
jgi:hypothetical protein